MNDLAPSVPVESRRLKRYANRLAIGPLGQRTIRLYQQRMPLDSGAEEVRFQSGVEIEDHLVEPGGLDLLHGPPPKERRTGGTFRRSADILAVLRSSSLADGEIARAGLPETGPHRLAEFAEERWPPGERAGDLNTASSARSILDVLRLVPNRSRMSLTRHGKQRNLPR